MLKRFVHISVPSPPAVLYNIKPLDCTQKCYILLLCVINLYTVDKSVKKMKKILKGKQEECKYQQPLIHLRLQEDFFCI